MSNQKVTSISKAARLLGNKKQVGTLDLTPTWRTAVLIYIECLQNPKAGSAAHQAAREDLLTLADAFDKVKLDKRLEKEPA